MFRDPTTERAVSQVVSFILVFSLVATTVGIVSAVGFDGLTGQRDSQRVENAERAFDVLADNIEDVYQDAAPSRATEVKLSDANLGMGATTTIRVDFPENASGPYETELRPVTFTMEGRDSSIVYEAGAVIRVDGGSAVMLREPPFRFEQRRTVIPVAKTSGTDAVSGSTTVLVRTEEQARSILYPLGNERADTPNGRLVFWFQTSTERAPAWERYFEAELSWVSDACRNDAPGLVYCEVPADDVPNEMFLSETLVLVEFE